MFSTKTNQHLIRSNLWSSQLKEVLLEELMGMKYVDWITDFPDGETINIPSIGQAESLDYVENAPIQYTAMDTGNFTFTVDQYKSSATYITNKMKQDSFYTARLVSSFVPKQARALAKAMEVKILDVGPSAQTGTSSNSINGAAHRWIAQGTNESMVPADFAKANYALDMANVPMQGRVAIVHPSVGYNLSTMANITNVINNPRWEGIIRDGGLTGTKFLMNIYGFDVYTSQNLKVNAGTQQIDSAGPTAPAGSYNNLFFSAASDVLPFVGLIRQSPKVDSEYNKDFQREEFVTTCRYGFKLFRPENLVVVVSANDTV